MLTNPQSNSNVVPRPACVSTSLDGTTASGNNPPSSVAVGGQPPLDLHLRLFLFADTAKGCASSGEEGADVPVADCSRIFASWQTAWRVIWGDKTAFSVEEFRKSNKVPTSGPGSPRMEANLRLLDKLHEQQRRGEQPPCGSQEQMASAARAELRGLNQTYRGQPGARSWPESSDQPAAEGEAGPSGLGVRTRGQRKKTEEEQKHKKRKS